jgi:hypothetical protein
MKIMTDSPQLFAQMRLPYEEGVIATLIKDGHRNSELFKLENWFVQQQHRLKLPPYVMRFDGTVDKDIAMGVLEALEAGHELNENDYLHVFKLSSLSQDPAIRARCEAWLYSCLDNNAFPRLDPSQNMEKNDLTLGALSFAATLDCLSLLKRITKQADVTMINRIDWKSKKEQVGVLINGCRRPEQIPMLGHLMDLTDQHKINWPNRFDDYSVLLRCPIASLNTTTLEYLVKDRGFDIHAPLKLEKDNTWNGLMCETINIVPMGKSSTPAPMIEMLSCLLRLGVPINPLAGENGILLSLMNSFHCKPELVEWLLENGADPNQTWSHSLADGKTITGAFPLLEALRKNQYPIAEVLIKYGADVDFIYEGDMHLNCKTLLGLAVYLEDERMANFLLDKGASLSGLSEEIKKDSRQPILNLLAKHQAQRDRNQLSEEVVLPKNRNHGPRL